MGFRKTVHTGFLGCFAMLSAVAGAQQSPLSMAPANKINAQVNFRPRPDSLMAKSWGHHSQFGVEALRALNLLNKDCGQSQVVVAVIDTGIDAGHPDLRNSLWINNKELNGKPGVDDDANGYIDDVNGWDFVTQSGRLMDTHRHGTHIAGIIGAKGIGKDSYSGVCPGVKIMTLRYYDERASGVDNLRNTVRSIEYAVRNGAHIINYSGGGAEFAQAEYKALKLAEEKGILVVAAAGNERSNADLNLYYPAAYDLNNIISVTAVNQEGQVLPSSNWGVKKVHVAAPGNSVLSTLPGGSYGFMTGTSQATAFVSGIAALMLTKDPSLSVAKIKDVIVGTAKKYPQLVGKTQSGALVNAHSALEKLMPVTVPMVNPQVLPVNKVEQAPKATRSTASKEKKLRGKLRKHKR